jgi:hypothetical protein
MPTPSASSSLLDRRAFLARSGLSALAFGYLGQTTPHAAGEPSAPKLTARWPRALVNRFHVSKIWSDGRHNGFPGIARVGNFYYIVFRNAENHFVQDGTPRIIIIRAAADDLGKWTQVGEFATDRDARDPLVFDNQGKVQVVYHNKEDYYSQSADGLNWPAPRLLDTEIVPPRPDNKLALTSTRRWLFRIRRGPDGAFYSLGRCGIKESKTPGRFGLILYRSEDGVKFKAMHTYGEGPITGLPSGRGTGHEADVGWSGDGTFMAAIRNSRNDGVVVVGPPPLGPFRALTTGTMTFGGPALHTTKKGGVLVAGRHRDPVTQLSYVRVSTVMPGGVDNHVILPSGGDCAYQSFADGPGDTVFMVYYSSHEHPQAKGAGRTPANIYLAHLTVRHEDPK